MPTIRIGTASPCTQATTSLTLTLLAQLAQRAAQLGIDLVLLPEAFLGGYPRGSTFGCVVGGRSDEGREEFARYFEQAVDLGDTVGEGGAGAGRRWVRREMDADGDAAAAEDDGDAAAASASAATKLGDGSREELERIARETGVFIVTGCIEKAGGSLYCAVVYVCPREGIIGKRRKVMPTGSERLIWAQGSPSTLRAVTTTIRGARVNLAAAICWESYMPLLRQALYAQNVNLYLAPTADARDSWLGLMRTVGIEGRCFVVSSNMCVRGGGGGTTTGGGRDAAGWGRGDRGDGRRRDSTVTEDGVEIALPSPTSLAKRHKHKRRKSVFDEDGNEIVLCCDADSDDQAKQQQQNGVTATQTTKTPFISRGGSSIVSPFGDVLAGPQWEDAEGLIYADVDLRDCIKGRLDLDTAGSYSRNDSFKFSVRGLDLDPLPY